MYIILSAAAFYNIAHVLFFYDVNNFDRLEPSALLISAGMLAVTVYMFYVAVKFFWNNIPRESEQAEIAREADLNKNSNENTTQPCKGIFCTCKDDKA